MTLPPAIRSAILVAMSTDYAVAIVGEQKNEPCPVCGVVTAIFVVRPERYSCCGCAG